MQFRARDAISHHHQLQHRSGVNTTTNSNRPTLSRVSSGASVVNCCPSTIIQQHRLDHHERFHPQLHPLQEPHAKCLSFSASTSATTTSSSLSPPESPLPSRGLVPMTTAHPSVTVSRCKRPQQSIPVGSSPLPQPVPYVEGAAVMHKPPFPLLMDNMLPLWSQAPTDRAPTANPNIFSKSTSFAVGVDPNSAATRRDVICGVGSTEAGQFHLKLPSPATPALLTTSPQQHCVPSAEKHRCTLQQSANVAGHNRNGIGVPPSPPSLSRLGKANDEWWQDSDVCVSTLDIPRLPHSERNSPAASSSDGNCWRPYASLGFTGSTETNSASKHLSTNAATQQSLRDDCLTCPATGDGPAEGTSWLHRRIAKTKLCVHHMHGRCARGVSCTFAHNTVELRAPPDLYKTRLCINFGNFGRCQKGESCRFAHGMEEMRTSEGELVCPPSEPLDCPTALEGSAPDCEASLGGSGVGPVSSGASSNSDTGDTAAAHTRVQRPVRCSSRNLVCASSLNVNSDICAVSRFEKQFSVSTAATSVGVSSYASSEANSTIDRRRNGSLLEPRTDNCSVNSSTASSTVDDSLLGVQPSSICPKQYHSGSNFTSVVDDAPSTHNYTSTNAPVHLAADPLGTTTNFNSTVENECLNMPRGAQERLVHKLLLRLNAGADVSNLPHLAVQSLSVSDVDASTVAVQPRRYGSNTHYIRQQSETSAATFPFANEYNNMTACDEHTIWSQLHDIGCDLPTAAPGSTPKTSSSSQGLSTVAQPPPQCTSPSALQRLQCYDRTDNTTVLNRVGSRGTGSSSMCLSSHHPPTDSCRPLNIRDRPPPHDRRTMHGAESGERTICPPLPDCHAMDGLHTVAPFNSRSEYPSLVVARHCSEENNHLDAHTLSQSPSIVGPRSMQSRLNRNVAIQVEANQASIAERCIAAIGITQSNTSTLNSLIDTANNDMLTAPQYDTTDVRGTCANAFSPANRCGDLSQSLRALRRSQSDITSVNYNATTAADDYYPNYPRQVKESTGVSGSDVRSWTSHVGAQSPRMATCTKRLAKGVQQGGSSVRLLSSEHTRQGMRGGGRLLGAEVGMLNGADCGDDHLAHESVWSAASFLHGIEREHCVRQQQCSKRDDVMLKVTNCNSSGSTETITASPQGDDSSQEDSCSAEFIARCLTRALSGYENGAGGLTGIEPRSDVNVEGLGCGLGDATNSSSSSAMNSDLAASCSQRALNTESGSSSCALGTVQSSFNNSLAVEHQCSAEKIIYEERDLDQCYDDHTVHRPRLNNCYSSNFNKNSSSSFCYPLSSSVCPPQNTSLYNSVNPGNSNCLRHDHQKSINPHNPQNRLQQFDDFDRHPLNTGGNFVCTGDHTADAIAEHSSHFNCKQSGLGSSSIGSLQPFRRSSSELVGVVDTRLLQQQYAQHGQHNVQRHQQHQLPFAYSPFEDACTLNKDCLAQGINAGHSREVVVPSKHFTIDSPQQNVATGGASNNQAVNNIRNYFKQQLLAEGDLCWTASGGANSRCPTGGAGVLPESVHLDDEMMSIVRSLQMLQQ